MSAGLTVRLTAGLIARSTAAHVALPVIATRPG